MTGQRLLHYQILEKLGEGGMGVVYKARDTHLDRFVAIKVLPPEKVSDPTRKARFIQEAKAASALNHPNIITVHDISNENGIDFIVMEYVDGKTLDQLIPRKGMRLSEALKIAVQIADALTRAHAAGIIHRDIKPANIMVDEHGLVKVLDFGLAKLVEASAVSGAEETTCSLNPVTCEGAIVGTIAYMSPEQVEGKPLDARSDIFSFGAVLYEMLAGKGAFQQDTKASTMAAVINQEPAPLEEVVPKELGRIMSRCLRKDRARRFQTMADVKVELEEIEEESDSGSLAASPAGGGKLSRRRLWIAGVSAAALLGSAALFWRLGSGQPAKDLKAVALTSYTGLEAYPSLSPDGNRVVFAWNGPKKDNWDIYVKQVGDSGDPLRLTSDAAGETAPAWSPDDRWIAFQRWQQSSRTWSIILIPPLGGSERRIVEVFNLSALSWTPDGKWLAFSAQDTREGVSTVRAINVETFEKRRLTAFESKGTHGDVVMPLGDLYPSISPDGRTLAFARQINNLVYLLYRLRLHDVRPEGEPERIAVDPLLGWGYVGTNAWTADSREIVFSTGPSLMRVSAAGGRSPKPLALASAFPSMVMPAISRTGNRLVYTWFYRNINLWRLNLATGERAPFITTSIYGASYPQYSPDGRRIAYHSGADRALRTCDAEGKNCLDIFKPQRAGTGSPQWSPDGRWLAYDSNADLQYEINVISAEGGAPRNATNHPNDDINPSWSQDGQWIYFASNRSGRFEMWKIPAGGGNAIQVTRSGGFRARESLDGKTLYYLKSGLGVFRMPAGGGPEEQIMAGPGRIGMSVTGRGVYWIPDGRTIKLYDNQGKTTTVATFEKIVEWMTVSPDDRFVVYGQFEKVNQDLMLVENLRP